jgi:NNP family nitrate/nitrite transporter-like MFS transporter
VYYPDHVGSVGGLVGMIGGLGGFVLPIAFGGLLDLTGVWQTSFMLMFVIVAISLVWMHVAIRLMERRKYPQLARETELSDLPDRPVKARAVASGARAAGGSVQAARATRQRSS